MRALIVNESVPTRKELKQALTREGFRVQVAASGRKAVDVLDEAGPVDLALVGFRPPGEEGLSFVRAVRSLRAYDAMRLIMVTESLNPEQVLAALRAGVDDCLVTPVTASRLGTKLAELGLRPGAVPPGSGAPGESGRGRGRGSGGAWGAGSPERFGSTVRGLGP